jgi:hypothetical protein
MKAILSATVAIFAIAGSTNAFTRAQLPPVERFTNLECVHTIQQPQPRDRNPAYKILVHLELADNLRDVIDLSAVHVLADGTRHDRNDQYSNANVWQKKGFNEWYWNGIRNNNRSIKMGGRLFRDSQGQWKYEETQFENGRQVWFMSSNCHFEFDGD